MNKRQSAVAGMFYPDSCKEIEHYINRFNQAIDDADYILSSDDIPRALIAPHAGYIYSGFTANMAYRTVAYNNSGIKRVTVIGPSHKVYVNGASVALYERYMSPCGDLSIDLPFSRQLENSFDFLHFMPDAHHEHSTETQMPFIRNYFKEAEVVEIVYGEIGYIEISQVIDTLLKEIENLIIISTDLSHFHTKKEAGALDAICINAIANLDPGKFDHGCEACGITGVKAIVKSALTHHFKSKVLDYRTSADSSGDESNVVGYMSAVFMG